jgi:hypothetical protein
MNWHGAVPPHRSRVPGLNILNIQVSKRRIHQTRLLHIQIPRFHRVFFDKLATLLDFVAHEDAEDVVGGAGVFHGDLNQRAVGESKQGGVETGTQLVFEWRG